MTRLAWDHLAPNYFAADAKLSDFFIRSARAGSGTDKVIILSTHILEEVDAVCSRAIIITRGKVVFDGTPGELKERSPSGRLDEVFREITTAAAPVLA